MSVREQILSTASRLFNAVGVHETGIDRIIKEGGFAKKSFYNHFKSKDALIEAYLVERDRIWFERLHAYTSREGLSALERVLALFDALYEWYEDPDFQGCPFIRGLSDFADKGNPRALKTCVNDHFTQTQDLVVKLVKPVCPKDYKKISAVIMSLIAGGTVVAHATGSPQVALVNKEITRQLLS